jgi:hypothetical protein
MQLLYLRGRTVRQAGKQKYAGGKRSSNGFLLSDGFFLASLLTPTEGIFFNLPKPSGRRSASNRNEYQKQKSNVSGE